MCIGNDSNDLTLNVVMPGVCWHLQRSCFVILQYNSISDAHCTMWFSYQFYFHWELYSTILSLCSTYILRREINSFLHTPLLPAINTPLHFAGGSCKTPTLAVHYSAAPNPARCSHKS